MKELEEFVREYFEIEGIPLEGEYTKKSTVDLAIYGYRKAGWTHYLASSWTKEYFPDKPKNQYLRTYILSLFDLKYCPYCMHVLDTSEYHKTKSTKDGLNRVCKSCALLNTSMWQKEKPELSRHSTSKYRAAKLNRTPTWADLEEIKEIYENCPTGYHVDHIIPLQGERVSGLHVVENLQYLPASENLSKSNKYEPA